MDSTALRRTPGFATGFSLLLPITLSTMAIVLLAPVLPRLLREFADVPHSEYLVPMILTVPALCVALFSPLAGILGDYFGRRRLLMASFIVYAVLGVAPFFLNSLPAILASRIGVGITEALIMVLSTTLIGDYFLGAARDRWLAAQTAFASISALLFFNLGGMLGTISWRAPFWVYLSALVMLLLVAVFTWEPGPGGSIAGADSPRGRSGWAGFPWPPMLLILAITVFASVLFYAVQIEAPIGLTLHGVTDPAKGGFLTSIASIGVPLGTLVYTRVGRAPVARLLTVEAALMALGFYLMGSTTSGSGFLIGCFVNQVGAGLLLPTLLVWAMSLLDFDNRGRGTGLWTGAFSVGQFLSPITITSIGGHWGGLFGSFSVLAITTGLAGALALVAAISQRTQHG